MEDTKKKKGLGGRLCALLWGLGLATQIGWNIEGQWFNTFIYTKIGKDPSIITAMVMLGSVATTFATFLFGTLTDRTGKRRTLISTGFIAWGILTICFSFIEFAGKEYYLLSCVLAVGINAFLCFFAAMSTNAGFSTWTTDIMTDNNKGQIGGIIAVECVLGAILGNILGGILVGDEYNYTRLFVLVGILLIVFGVCSIFLMGKKDDVAPHKKGTFFSQFIKFFNFKDFFKIKELVFVNIAVTIYFIGYNCYFTHMGNYLIYYLGYTPTMIGIIQAIPLTLAMLVAVPVSNMINKNKHLLVTVIAVITSLIGMFIITPVKPDMIDNTKIFDIRIWLSIFLIGTGYIIIMQTTKVWTKQLHPEESKGQFEGIWVVFSALIPTILGSMAGQIAIKTSGLTITNELTGQLDYIPNGNIYFIGVLISALSFIPFYIAHKFHKKKK